MQFIDQKVSEYDQEMPQLHNAAQPMALWGRGKEQLLPIKTWKLTFWFKHLFIHVQITKYSWKQDSYIKVILV